MHSKSSALFAVWPLQPTVSRKGLMFFAKSGISSLHHDTWKPIPGILFLGFFQAVNDKLGEGRLPLVHLRG